MISRLRISKQAWIFAGIILFIILYFRFNRSDCLKRISYQGVKLNEGIDLDSLYKPVTEMEIDGMREKWKRFPLRSDSFRMAGEFSFTSSRPGKVIVHYSGSQKHYGALIFPLQYTKAKKYPLLVWANGLNQALPQVDLDKITARKGLFKRLHGYFILVPSYRGQELRVQGRQYCSDGFFGDAFHGASTDALRLLEMAQSLYPSIDSQRIAICGTSRGGTVSLLAGIRDPSIRTVISLAAPTDFYSKRKYYRYGKQYAYQFLSQTKDINLIRQKILMSSPYHFIDSLQASLLLIHGEKDHTVPVYHAEKIMQQLTDKADFQSVILDGGHILHEWERIISWLKVHNQ